MDPGQGVAIVEEVSSNLDGIKPFDVIAEGQSIQLGESGRLVLGYFNSCWEDHVTAGRVIVEAQHSRLEGGTLVRRRVECDVSGLSRTASRKAPTRRAVVPLTTENLPDPDIILYGLSPVVMSKAASLLIIERLDIPDIPVRFEIGSGAVDLFERNFALDRKGLYRFTSGFASIIIRVDELAEPALAPVIGRLLMFR